MSISIYWQFFAAQRCVFQSLQALKNDFMHQVLAWIQSLVTVEYTVLDNVRVVFID